MWKPERCDLCGECLEACQYLGYDRDKAKEEMKAIIEGRHSEVFEKCITCCACNTYCNKGAKPFDLIIHRMEEEGPAYQRGAATNVLETFCFDLARNFIRKTKKGAPWMSICCMEYFQPHLFWDSKLFEGLNIVGGGDYFCVNGMVHGRQDSMVFERMHNYVERLNKLPTDEIVFYHDECYSPFFSYAEDMKLEPNFKPVHLLEWLLKVVKDNYKDVHKLGIRAAVQLPCSIRCGPDRHVWLDELFDLLGVELIEREYDRRNQLCCGAVAGLGGGTSASLRENQIFSEALRARNIKDAKSHGADHMVFLCPFCYAALARDDKGAGIMPLMAADLVRMSLFDEKPTEYITALERGWINQ